MVGSGAATLGAFRRSVQNVSVVLTTSDTVVGSRSRAMAEMATSLLLVVVSLWLLARLNDFTAIYFHRYNGYGAPFPLFVSTAFAACFARERYEAFIPLLRLALRSSACGLLAYLILEPPDFTLANQSAVRAFGYVRYGYPFALILAAVSIFRPSFIIPSALYIYSTRHLVEHIANLKMSTLDIQYMLDMALFLAIFGVILLGLCRRVDPLFNSEQPQQEITYVAFGLHLGNYFWSGVAKLLVGPYPWTWIIGNQTFNTIPYAIVNGTLPIGHLPLLIAAVYAVMQFAVRPLNVAIVGFQLFAILSPLRLLWLKVASIFYDLLHIGIWLLGGLFFWPWVWNNLTILVAARAQASPVSLTAKLACVLTILLGFPALPFYKAAWLGWFDVVDARQTYFEAVTKQGQKARVPTSFFLSHGYSVSHGYMDTAEHPGHFGFTFWGSASYERLLTSGKCVPAIIPISAAETEESKRVRLEKVGAFIRAHHAKMKDRHSWFGDHSYYYSRFHHHPSNPFLFGPFNALDLRDVVAYNLVVEFRLPSPSAWLTRNYRHHANRDTLRCHRVKRSASSMTARAPSALAM